MAAYIAEAGEFTRDTKYIETRITADGRDGYPRASADRYRLIVARACPWANRAIIVRRLLGLERGSVHWDFAGPPTTSAAGPSTWIPGGVDPVLRHPSPAVTRISRRFPDYPKGITVPAIVDVPSGAVVTNDFAADDVGSVD